MQNREKILFDDGKHKCVMFSFDDESHEDAYLSVNQYLIVKHGAGILVDPGSEIIFDELYSAVEKHVKIENIKYIFFSHQDPDVAASISQWALATSAKFMVSNLWTRFLSHYGFMDMNRVMPIKDHGAKLQMGEDFIKFIPAHFLHSPGNFSLYDSRSKILFSGDIGAAVVSSPDGYKMVADFNDHKTYLEAFHKRYMGSNKLCKAWVAKVREYEISMIAPQHGFVFEDKNVELFLKWLENLQCGSDYIEELY